MQVEIGSSVQELAKTSSSPADGLESVTNGVAPGQILTEVSGMLIVDPSALPSLLTAGEVASLLRLKSEKAVYAIAASGALPGVVRVGRRFRVRRDELLRHLDGKKRG